MTLATESPRMAPLHAAARRAVEYMDDRAPMLDADTSLSQYMERPSLLAYNRPLAKQRFAQQHQPQSRASQHMQQYMPYRPSQRDTTSRPSTASTDDESMSARLSEDRASWYTSDEDSPYHDHPFAATPPLPFHEGVEGDDEEESKDEERTDKADDDDHVHLLEAPRPADVPLLEIDEEEPEQEVDTILGDLTRLPRTTIIDEDGFLVDPRASLSHPAANGAMGLGVSRPGMIIKSGLLFKQGFAFMNGGWKVRHAELTSSKLTFFKGEHGRKRGVVDLATCSPKSIEIMPRDSVFDGSQATMWRFAIKTKGRRVMVSAYSEADMKEWLRCLHVALAVQSSGAGRLTDFVVPNGTLLANKGDGLMRASGSGFMG